jgi:hypothetical protein
MQPRRARRTDSNHDEIAKAFRAFGFLVHRTNAAWDLTVMRFGRPKVWLIEVKDGSKSPSRRVLTGPEKKLQDDGWPIHVIESVDDVRLFHQSVMLGEL